MKVLLFAPYFPPAVHGGGPIRTLAALTRTAPSTAQLSIITRDRDLGASEPLPVDANVWTPSQHGEARVRYTSFDRLGTVIRAMWSSRGHQDIVYLNSFFDPRLSILPLLLHRLHLWGKSRLLVAPRGEFSAGALALKSRKKRLFIRIFRLLASRRLIWHASTVEEARDIAAAVGGHPAVVVREDETDLPEVAMLHAVRPHDRADTLRVVFASRISPKKGLLVLLEALSRVTAPVVLDIHGPEEDVAEVLAARRLVDAMPAHVVCTFHGPAHADSMRDLFARYDLFAFPTAGENFGHVIAEALSTGCPVMLSNTTPWSDIIRSGGGVLVDSREPAEWARRVDEFAQGGPARWEAASHDAAAAYHRWATTPKGAHVFELVMRS